MAVRAVALFAFFALASCGTYAFDLSQLQDFCIATDSPNSGVSVNGQFCKNPNDVVVDDFIFKGLNVAGTLNKMESSANLVDVHKFKGLNTLGLTIARIDFGPNGLNPPHTHPRGSEIFTVLEGTLYAGFVTSNLPEGGNKLFAKTLHKGDSFAFPQGLIHFQLNNGTNPAVGFAVLNSQNPGRIDIGNAVFGSYPPIPADVLTKALRLNDVFLPPVTTTGHPPNCSLVLAVVMSQAKMLVSGLHMLKGGLEYLSHNHSVHLRLLLGIVMVVRLTELLLHRYLQTSATRSLVQGTEKDVASIFSPNPKLNRTLPFNLQLTPLPPTRTTLIGRLNPSTRLTSYNSMSFLPSSVSSAREVGVLASLNWSRFRVGETKEELGIEKL